MSDTLYNAYDPNATRIPWGDYSDARNAAIERPNSPPLQALPFDESELNLWLRAGTTGATSENLPQLGFDFDSAMLHPWPNTDSAQVHGEQSGLGYGPEPLLNNSEQAHSLQQPGTDLGQAQVSPIVGYLIDSDANLIPIERPVSF
jgi:hypothetical protein